MKTITFLGDSLQQLRDFPPDAKQDAGYALHQVQNGDIPSDFKLLPSIGSGIYEIRIRDESGAYRVIYTAKFPDTVYVLHAFQKKTAKTAQGDINLVRERYRRLLKELS